MSSVLLSCIPVGVSAHPLWVFLSMFLYPSVLFDPVPNYREPYVHAWLVPLSTAFTPAHHTSLEDSPIFLHTGQGATGVTLRKNKSCA